MVAAAIVGSAVVGAAGASVAAGSASDAASAASAAQQESANKQIVESRRQFDQMQQLLSPYVQAGTGALAGMQDLLGIGGMQQQMQPQQQMQSQQQMQPQQQMQSQQQMQPQQLSPSQTPPSGIRRFGLDSVGKAPLQQQQQMQQMQPQQMQQMQPQQMGQSGFGSVNPEMAQANAIRRISEGPQMAAMIQQGENAILQNASATGGLRGGNTQGALAQFRPQILNQLIDQQFSRLGGIANMGQNAAAGVGSAGQYSSGQINNAYAQQGAAQAGNALAQGQISSDLTSSLGQAAGTAFTGIGKMFGGAPAAAAPSANYGFGGTAQLGTGFYQG